MDNIFIESQRKFLAYVNSLLDKKSNIIALDIEAELNRHAYGETLCLIQIFDGYQKILVDPFRIGNGALKLFFEHKNTLKVMYDASSDSSLLKNSYDIEITSILDLRPAVDLLNYAKEDLYSVIAAELGITLENKSKYQKHNWTKRPIDKQAIDYALNDVAYLLRLKDAIYKKLFTQNLFDLFILKNLQIQGRDFTRDPESKYRNIKGFYRLSAAERDAFRRIYDVRDKYARLNNMPPHNIVNNAELINIVKGAQHISELRFPRRFGADLVREIVKDLENAIKT